MKETANFRWLIRLINLLLIMVILYLLMRLTPVWTPILNGFVRIFTPFFIAAFIAYLLHPIIEGLHARNVPRPAAVLIIYVLFFGGAAFLTYKFTPMMIEQLKDLGNSIPSFLETYQRYLQGLYEQTAFLPEEFHNRMDAIFSNIEQRAGEIVTIVLNSTGKLINSIFLFAIIPFIVFYLLKDFPLVKKSSWYITPRKWRKPLWYLLRDINTTLGQYIRGQLLVCTIIGTVATVSLWLAGMKYPLVLGLIIGVTNIIPYFGPVIGAVPAVIIALTISIKMVIIVIVIITILQFLEGNLLSPLIVGKSLHMHPVFIIAALLIGGEIGGIVGLILAVPLLSVMKVIILHTVEHMGKH